MDYKYTVKHFEIKCKSTDRVILIPFGDIHRDSRNCDVDRWHWFCEKSKKILKENEHVYFVSMGDIHDFASTSEVHKLKSNKLHDDTLHKFDFIAQEQNRAFCQEIDFMRGRLLGFVDGNHNWVMTDGKSSNEDLAERMGSESLGWLCHYTLTFVFTDRGGEKEQNVYLVLCHGKAGGKTAGNSVNQVEWLRNIFQGADIYLMGHDHERWARPLSVLMPTRCKGGTKLKQKRQYLGRTGSFLKGYCADETSYIVGGLYRPSDLGAIRFNIGVHRDQRNGEDRMITDIEAIV